MILILYISQQARPATIYEWGRLLVFFTCIIAVTAQPVSAEVEQFSYTLEHIDNKAGLPQNAVRGVLVDRDGFVWAGTEKGLARYDGYRFINFSELVAEIPEDVSLGLQLDSKNRIWTAWYSHSLRIFMANRKDVFIIDPAEGYPNDLKLGASPKMVESADGAMWFPGRSNVYRLDQKNNITSQHISPSINSDGLAIGKLVVFGTRAGLLLIDTESWKPEHVYVPAYSLNPSKFMGGTMSSIANGTTVIFCHTTGVFSYDSQSGVLTRIPTTEGMQVGKCKQLGTTMLISLHQAGSEGFEIVTLDIKSGILIPNKPGLPESGTMRSGLSLHDTFVDNNNNHWVLLGEKLYQSHGPDGSYQEIFLPNKPFGIEAVFAQSHSGAVWIRTDGHGLAKLSHYSKRFQTITPPPAVSQSSQVRGMAVDRDNNVWLANDERKLLYWNRSTDTWTDQLPGNTGTLKNIEILPDGTVWVSLPDIKTIMGFDPNTKSWEHTYKFSFLSHVLGQMTDGRLVSAERNHVILIDPKTRKVEKLTEEPINGQIRAFKQDKNGNIWLGAHEAGLRRIDSNGHIKSWTKENSAISSNHIFSLHFDNDGLLWIGTWHGGLLSFNPGTEEFKHYGVDAGLPDSTVFEIQEDDSGYLWLSTYVGLVRFGRCPSDTACEPDITLFDHHDGLQADEFDADSSYKSSQGEMFFAGLGGLNAFYPENIPLNQQPPSVRISRVQLNDGPLPGAASEFTYPDPVRLSFGFGELRLEVSVLDFNDPEKNRLQYRDLSNGNSWKDMQLPFLLIRGLSDGSHTFQFRGTNNDGVWSSQPAEIKFVVAPPVYRHPLTLLIYLVLAVLFPVVYFHRKEALLLQRQQDLKKEVQKRTHELELANTARERFFANVSHEICSPVHMILLMLENHMNESSNEDKNIYKSATGYAAQLMVYLKQLVGEARSHEADSHLYAADPGTIINSLVRINQPIARARSISLKVIPMPAERVAFYSSSAISIFSNLLCNALIYTPEHGEIILAGEVNNGLYCVLITNTISPEQASDIEHFFERGNRGDFNANYFGGHGLGLSIVTSAVEILGGHINVKLKDANNIVFTVYLPLAESSMLNLPDEGDLAFSYEQMLAIKLMGDNEITTLENDRKPVNGISVLIIEDDVQVANLISQSLAKTYTVYVAGSYTDGVRLARKHQPNVILCDLFLPDQSGFDVLKAVRANRMTMDTFFVMVTASISETDRLRGQQLGVDQFVRKPVSAETLKLLIRNHMVLSKQRTAHIQDEKLVRKARIDTIQHTQRSFEMRFSEALEELYQDPGTSIENLQTRLSMSYATLMRNCKTTFGQSPKRLLIEKRISVAKELLLSSTYKVGLIAELSGFSTHSQFAIVFKRETGTTPAAFRKNQ